MRRVGVVGDGLTGLIASLSIGSNGVRLPYSVALNPWVDWHRQSILMQPGCSIEYPYSGGKSHLHRLLKRMKVLMPTRQLPLSKLAVIRDDQRKTLPNRSGLLRKPTGPFASEWIQLIQAARNGTTDQLNGPIRDAATLLSLLWNCQPEPNDEAVIAFAWKGHPKVPIDGWCGVSGRLITACMQTDVTFHLDGPVTGFRRKKNGQVDGIKRKGRVLPVDAVIQASSRDKSSLVGRYLGLSGQFLRPHSVLWDVIETSS